MGIFFSTFFLILSLFAFSLLNGSAAWFADNRDVDAENMSVKVKSPDTVVDSVEYYPISSISLSESQNIYTFSNNNIAENETKQLGTFSTLVAERQLLIKINLKPEATGARVVASSYADSYIIEDEDTIINKDGNSLSSVVEFYPIDYDLVEKTSDGEYIISSDSMQNVARFSDIDAKYGSIPASFSPEAEIYSTPEGKTDTAIFVIVDYYEKSVEYVIDYVNNLIMGAATDVVAGETINFICDFEILVVEA